MMREGRQCLGMMGEGHQCLGKSVFLNLFMRIGATTMLKPYSKVKKGKHPHSYHGIWALLQHIDEMLI